MFFATCVQRSPDTFTTRPTFGRLTECLASSSSTFKTPQYEYDNFLKTNHSKYDFTFGPWNCHSAGSKSCSLHNYISHQQFVFFCLTETWLGTAIDETILRELLPPGYNIHHQPWLGGKAGRGVALLYKENINVVRTHKDIYFSTFEFLRMCL